MVSSYDLNHPLTVSQITGYIQQTLEEGFAGLWIKGEISNLTRHSSGHWYFSLKDSGAQLGAVMFRRQNQSVRFEIAHGMQITAHGRISVYPPQGRYQLIVDQMLPAGQGDLHLAFEALKKKLAAEGLFAAERKQVLPRYPACVGLITSPTGAAVRDMLQVLERRFPLARVQLLPVKVQGAGAASEIAGAIDAMNKLGTCEVLIVGRGGGSLEDLWAFNEEEVARAVFRSVIPVVSGVGHETDITIIDYVADQRAPTPSAAAELVVPDRRETARQLSALAAQLRQQVRERLAAGEHRLQAMQTSYALKRPVLIIDQALQDLDRLQDTAQRSLTVRLERAGEQLNQLKQQLKILNPLAVLERGYSVISNASGKVLTSVSQIAVKDQLRIRLHDGRLQTEVKSIDK